MEAMVLKEISAIEKEPLEMIDLPNPVPGSHEILIKISACCGQQSNGGQK